MPTSEENRQKRIRHYLIKIIYETDIKEKEKIARHVLRLDRSNPEAWIIIAGIVKLEHHTMAEFQKRYLKKYPLLAKERTTLAKSRINYGLIVAIIGVLVAVIGILPIIAQMSTTPLEIHLLARIANEKGEAIQGANVVFATDQDKYSAFSDVTGYVLITGFSKGKDGRLFVETKQYAPYDLSISLPPNNPLDVRLSPRDPNNRTVIIRVSDSVTHLPVEGAEINLVVFANPYIYSTDSIGLTPRFSLAFGNKDELDADIFVKTKEYESKHIRVTLQAERLQDILIDPTGVIVAPTPNTNLFNPSLAETPTFVAYSPNLPTETSPPATPIIVYEIVSPTHSRILAPMVTSIFIVTNIPTNTPTPNPTNTLTLTPIAVPFQPSLISPTNTSSIIGNSLKFTWNSIANATEYYVEYTGPSNGNSGWITTPSFDVNSLSSGTYNWHVKARNLGGESSWSDWWTFTLQPPADVWVHVQGSGFEFTGMSGWVEIRTQNTVHSSIDANVIYTQTRAIGASNDKDWVRWRPSISTSGYYRVCIFAPWYTNSRGITNKARYLIHHAGGDSNPPEFPTRQSDFSNSWMDLGRYQFNNGVDGYVYMGDYTGDNPIRLISADAAKFIWAPLGTETCQ